MFHVLTPDSVPPFLSAGYEGRPVSVAVCGRKGGDMRNAISYEKAQTYENNNKLAVERLCSACANKLGIRK